MNESKNNMEINQPIETTSAIKNDKTTNARDLTAI